MTHAIPRAEYFWLLSSGIFTATAKENSLDQMRKSVAAAKLSKNGGLVERRSSKVMQEGTKEPCETPRIPPSIPRTRAHPCMIRLAFPQIPAAALTPRDTQSELMPTPIREPVAGPSQKPAKHPPTPTKRWTSQAHARVSKARESSGSRRTSPPGAACPGFFQETRTSLKSGRKCEVTCKQSAA